jgi:predicted glycogen debranching enzyme
LNTSHTGQVTSLRYGPQVCGDLAAGAEHEWLITDGLGGYGMGTLTGLRTRRYHGLLVVAGAPAARRMMALAALDAVVTLPSGTSVQLGTHEWSSGVIAPEGFRLLESFDLTDGVPRWRWRIGTAVIEREIAYEHERASIGVVHRLLAGGPVTLALEPLCTWRDAHAERYEQDGLAVEAVADGVLVESAYRLWGPGFEPEEQWYSGALHRDERERGLAATEDLVRVGRFTQRLEVGDALEVNAWAGDLARTPPPASIVISQARQRARDLVAGLDGDTATLRRAADTFVIRSESGAPDVVAGYPWFGTWSRDTMIAYEGLFLSTGRVDQGRTLLRAYAATLSEGMLANTADTGQVEYNTADATLWFLHAVERHVTRTGDNDLAAEVVGALDDVVRHHLDGTRFGIRIDKSDHLLTQGAAGYSLTWMDAVIGGIPATPRTGKAVELNALWINGLGALARIRRGLGQAADDLDHLRERSVASFRLRFPSGRGWLYDVVDTPTGDDASLRPNQLFAFGLPYAPLRNADPAPVRYVGDALLTPIGLRTLACDDPAYAGQHRGDPASRDRAYHQGTVWPWLLGPYIDAARSVGLPTDGLLDGVRAHLAEWGVGSVSETADGDAPHRATGCPFQAWSVAETYRCLTMEAAS